MISRRARIAIGAYLAASAAVTLWLLPAAHERPPSFEAPRSERSWPVDPEHADAIRDLALRQARVWNPANAGAADLSANPPDPTGVLSGDPVRCRYLPAPAHGTTAKFACVLPDGEVVKVKYGHTGEIHAELAATRLLTALGFGADRMYLISRLRCYGCLRTPFYTAWVLDYAHARNVVARAIPGEAYVDFEWVTVERRFEGAAIETRNREGWAFHELDHMDVSSGVTRAERDALRLAALLLAHWDNKAANQRLVCVAAESATPGPCPHPFALIHDLGATFGPNKLELDHWKAAPIWADRPSCRVSMRQFPYGGGTFPDTQISEGGRQLIATQLVALSERQLESLFSGARFREFDGGNGESADPGAWARALAGRIRQIADGPACPG